MSNRTSSPPVVWASDGCCGRVRRAGVGAASYWETERESKNKTCSERTVCSPAEWGHFSTPMRLPLMSAALSVSPIELQLHLFKRSLKGKGKFFSWCLPSLHCQPPVSFSARSWSCRLTLCAACRSDACWFPSVPGVDRGGNWSAALFRPQLTGMVFKTLWQLKSPRYHTVSDVNEEA